MRVPLMIAGAYQRGEVMRLGTTGGVVQTIALLALICFGLLVVILCSRRLPARWQEELRLRRQAYWNEYSAQSVEPEPGPDDRIDRMTG